MSPQRLKMTLSDYQRKDGRAYQTLLEHIKRKTLDGFQENGRWYVWTDMEAQIVEGEPFEAKHQSLETNGLLEFMRREQDLKKDLQDRVYRLMDEAKTLQLEQAKTPPQGHRFNWLYTLIGLAIGATATAFSFLPITSKMEQNYVRTIESHNNTMTKFNEINKVNLEALRLQHQSEIDNINQQHKIEIERLANLHKGEIERLRVGENVQR